MGKGKPRLDKYSRLFARFYECLAVLTVLHKTTGPHRTMEFIPDDPNCIRRRFLNNLAYLCDIVKGGPTTTAIAVEERDDIFMFWISQNKEEFNSITIRFLLGVIGLLRAVLGSTGENRKALEEALIDHCIRQARDRIKKESQILCRNVKKCKIQLLETDKKDKELHEWLCQFECDASWDPVAQCRFAHKASKTPQIKDLKEKGKGSAGTPNSGYAANPFRQVRHYIGRLARRVNAVRELFEDGQHLTNVLDSCDVSAVPAFESVAQPEPDSQTHLEGILRRMSKDEEEWKKLEPSVPNINSIVDPNLESRILWLYERSSSPCVHAEIQVLEHFHQNGLMFAMKDRFVGCSKFACLCCKLYFRHHPAKPVEPESHEKLYINWGPEDLAHDSKGPEAGAQRVLITKVLHDLRGVALDRLQDLINPVPFHPDSLTGITALDSETDANWGSSDEEDELVDTVDDDWTASSATTLENGTIQDDSDAATEKKETPSPCDKEGKELGSGIAQLVLVDDSDDEGAGGASVD